MNILVTGGAGYIGSLLIERLLSLGHYVRVLDNLFFKQDVLDRFLSNDRFEFIFGDVRKEEDLKSAVYKIDYIFPLACLVGAPLCEKMPVEAKEVNLDSIKTLISLLTDQKIIYPTTNSGYGTKTGDVYCTEESSLDPISLYGQTKVGAEKLILETNKGVTFRLATVFGSSYRNRFDLMVNDFVFRALKEKKLVLYEGNYKRNFVHIKDVIDCFVFALDNFEELKGQCFNLGLDSANISKYDLAGLIKEYVPELEIELNEYQSDPDKRNYVVSNEKLRQAGFEAKRSLESGIKELIEISKTIILKT